EKRKLMNASSHCQKNSAQPATATPATSSATTTTNSRRPRGGTGAGGAGAPADWAAGARSATPTALGPTASAASMVADVAESVVTRFPRGVLFGMHTTPPAAELLVAHAEFVQRLARGLAGGLGTGSGDDLAQDTWVRALGARGAHRSLRGWLAAIAANLWRN